MLGLNKKAYYERVGPKGVGGGKTRGAFFEENREYGKADKFTTLSRLKTSEYIKSRVFVSYKCSEKITDQVSNFYPKTIDISLSPIKKSTTNYLM